MDLLIRLRALAPLVAGLVVFAGCTRDVDAPEFDSPFDPNSPTAGEAWDLQAAVVGDAVQLTWANVPGQSGFLTADSTLISVFTVSHGTGSSGTLTQATGVRYPAAPAPGSPVLARHRDYEPETINRYRIDSGLIVSSLVVMVDAPLEVVTTGGLGQASALDVEFRVRSGISDAVEFALDSAFTERDSIFAIEAGVSTPIVYPIVPFTAADDTLRVFFRGRTDVSTGAVGSILLEPVFDPLIEAESGTALGSSVPFVAVDDTVTFRADGIGVTGLVIQATVDSVVVDLQTVADPSQPFPLPLDDARARDDENARWDFIVAATTELGFTVSTPVPLLEAGPVSGAGATIVEETDGVVTAREITLRLTATDAGEFIVSESADFTGAVWRDLVDEHPFVLSDGAGAKTIFVAFRNDFDPGTAVTSVTTIYVPTPTVRASAER